MNSNSLSRAHLYQLTLLIILFVITLVITVWMYSGSITRENTTPTPQTPEEIRAEVRTWLSKSSTKLDEKGKAQVSGWLGK